MMMPVYIPAENNPDYRTYQAYLNYVSGFDNIQACDSFLFTSKVRDLTERQKNIRSYYFFAVCINNLKKAEEVSFAWNDQKITSQAMALGYLEDREKTINIQLSLIYLYFKGSSDNSFTPSVEKGLALLKTLFRSQEYQQCQDTAIDTQLVETLKVILSEPWSKGDFEDLKNTLVALQKNSQARKALNRLNMTLLLNGLNLENLSTILKSMEQKNAQSSFCANRQLVEIFKIIHPARAAFLEGIMDFYGLAGSSAQDYAKARELFVETAQHKCDSSDYCAANYFLFKIYHEGLEVKNNDSNKAKAVQYLDKMMEGVAKDASLEILYLQALKAVEPQHLSLKQALFLKEQSEAQDKQKAATALARIAKNVTLSDDEKLNVLKARVYLAKKKMFLVDETQAKSDSTQDDVEAIFAAFIQDQERPFAHRWEAAKELNAYNGDVIALSSLIATIPDKESYDKESAFCSTIVNANFQAQLKTKITALEEISRQTAWFNKNYSGVFIVSNREVKRTAQTSQLTSEKSINSAPAAIIYAARLIAAKEFRASNVTKMSPLLWLLITQKRVDIDSFWVNPAKRLHLEVKQQFVGKDYRVFYANFIDALAGGEEKSFDVSLLTALKPALQATMLRKIEADWEILGQYGIAEQVKANFIEVLKAIQGASVQLTPNLNALLVKPAEAQDEQAKISPTLSLSSTSSRASSPVSPVQASPNSGSYFFARSKPQAAPSNTSSSEGAELQPMRSSHST